MEEPKTVKGYLKRVESLDLISVSELKGFEKLSDDDKWVLRELSAMISNQLGDLDCYDKSKRLNK